MKKRTLMILVLVIAAGILTACSKGAAEAASTVTPAGPAYALIAEGSLTPVRALDLSFPIPGTVSEVLVKDGQSVTNGQLLVRLANNADALLALAQAEQEALAAQQALDEVKSSSLSSSEAALALAQAQSNYNFALGNYWNRNNTQGTADMIATNRAKLTILDNKIKDLEKEYNGMSETPDSDTKKAQTLQNLSQARIDRVELKKLVDYYEAMPDQLDVTTLKAELDVAKSKLDDAQRVYNRMQNGIDPNELAAAEARSKTANAAVASAQSALDATEIRASINGTVVDPNVIPGEQVAANQVLISVADYSAWVVKTDNLTEADIVNISVDQKVNVELDALPDVTLTGIVSHINSRFEEKRGDITYTVTVTLTQTDPRMRWGMTAAVKFLK